MAATESAARFEHFSHHNQQRRLRHLNSVAARNIVLKRETETDITQCETYFTLHKDAKSKAFYESERIKGSMNPTWRNFDISLVSNDNVDTAGSYFVVRVWSVQKTTSRLCIDWQVSIGGLVLLGNKLQREGLQFQADSLIFGFFDGYYGQPTDKVMDYKESPQLVESFEYLVSGGTSFKKVQVMHNNATVPVVVDQSLERASYNVQTLSRIQTILRAIKQTQASGGRLRQSIEERLLHSQLIERKKAAREMLMLRVGLMRDDLEWRTAHLKTEKETYEMQQTGNYQRDVTLKGKFDTVQKDKARLHEKKKSYFDVREELIKAGAQLVMRRKQLINELAFIYPIHDTQNDEFLVCGARLPNSEQFGGHDEIMIAVSLGYTSHLVEMISQFLDVPVRYGTIHRGSRSLITDHIIDKLPDKDRDFPLYSKGKEKLQFNYGVYLLNKNIAQLRYYCGLGTTDLRLTLPNLKTLLELRLGVKFEARHLPGQHLSIPPNLGGPQKSTSPSFGHTSQTHANQSTLPPTLEAGHDQSDTAFEQILRDAKNQTDKYLNQKMQPSEDQTSTSTSSRERTPDSLDDKKVDEDIFRSSPGNFFAVKHPTAILSSRSDNSTQSSNGSQGAEKECYKQEVAGTSSLQARYNSYKVANRTSEQLAKERLLGPLYDDIDMSSSEDSASVTYRSSFKTWPRGDTMSGIPKAELQAEKPHLTERTAPGIPDIAEVAEVEDSQSVSVVQQPNCPSSCRTEEPNIQTDQGRDSAQKDSCVFHGSEAGKVVSALQRNSSPVLSKPNIDAGEIDTIDKESQQVDPYKNDSADSADSKIERTSPEQAHSMPFQCLQNNLSTFKTKAIVHENGSEEECQAANHCDKPVIPGDIPDTDHIPHNRSVMTVETCDQIQERTEALSVSGSTFKMPAQSSSSGQLADIDSTLRILPAENDTS